MTRQATRFATIALTGLVLAACRRDDPRLDQLTLGMSKDSTLNTLGIGTPERPEAYLVSGQMIEAVILRREGADGPLDSLSTEQYTPVVIVNNKLAGWGWKYWDSVKVANNIVRADSTAR